MTSLTKFLSDHPQYRRKLRWQIYLRDQKCKICNLEIEQVLLKRAGNHTYYAPCSSVSEKLIWFNIDHIVSRSTSGGNKFSNLRTTCQPCNEKKGAQLALVSEGLTVPSNYEAELLEKLINKRIHNNYPDWKPYYGF